MRRVLAALGLLLAVGGCSDSEKRPAKRAFSAQGVQVTAPQGWHGRASSLPVRGVRPKALVQVASFSLGRPPPKSMRRGDALLTLAEDYGLIAFDTPIAAARSPLRRSEFLPASSPRVPAGQALAERDFSVHGRNFRLSVNFGSRPQSRLLSDVNDALASLDVKAASTSTSRGIAVPTARLRACRGRGFGGRGLEVAGVSCREAGRLTTRFAPHPGDVVERLGDFTCQSSLIPRRFIRVVCISGTRVVRFNFY